MQGPYNQAYEPLGDLLIDFAHGDEATDYQRSLDLDSAISTVTYTSGESRILRETVVSAPDQVMVLHLASSKPGGLTCTLRLKSLLQSNAEANNNRITLSGNAPAN